MKIAWIADDFHPEIGGIPTYVESIVRCLSVDHQVFLVTDRTQSPRIALNAEHFGCSNLRGTTRTVLWRQCRQDLHAVISRFRPDVIHFATAGMAVFANDLSNLAPMVCSVHGNDLTSPWQILPDPDPTSFIVDGLESCSRLIAVSSYVAGLIRGRLKNESCVQIILNSCDTHLFKRQAIEREQVLQRLGVPLERKVVLTVSRLEARKGHFLLLKALRLTHADWHWIVVGKGAKEEKLLSKIDQFDLADRVSMLGWCEPERLPSLYSVCDVFILVPQILTKNGRVDSEGFGVVYHEAGACGAPVIASRGSGAEEAIRENETGMLVAADNVDELRSAIRWMFTNDKASRAMGELAAKEIARGGGWCGIARQISEVYRQVIYEGNRRKTI